MAIVPFTATGRVTITYTTNTFPHKVRVPVNLSLPYVVPGNLLVVNPSGGTVAAGPAAQHLWDLLRANYPSTVLPASYLVEQNSSGLFTPLESGALTGAGTNVAAIQPANEWTITMKDLLNHKFKLIFLESSLAAPNSFVYPSGIASLDTLATELLTTTVSTTLGNWIKSRGASTFIRCAKETGTFNKRIRRSRHII